MVEEVVACCLLDAAPDGCSLEDADDEVLSLWDGTTGAGAGLEGGALARVDLAACVWDDDDDDDDDDGGRDEEDDTAAYASNSRKAMPQSLPSLR
jgi:hypothetical protein